MSERKDPTEQLQIYEPVVYLPEGVLTRIAGYRWQEEVGKPPRIVAYVLECGCDAHRDHIARPDEMPELAGG